MSSRARTLNLGQFDPKSMFIIKILMRDLKLRSENEVMHMCRARLDVPFPPGHERAGVSGTEQHVGVRGAWRPGGVDGGQRGTGHSSEQKGRSTTAHTAGGGKEP